jgi:predicted site-specific integrase-resolvase
MVLPRLVDCKTIMDQMGVSRATAERYMRACRRVPVPGSRKWLVKESDIAAHVEREESL